MMTPERPGGQMGPELRLGVEQSPLILPQQRLIGTEFLDHLTKADQFYETTRDRFISNFPYPRTMFIVVWGRTGSGKKTAISQLIHKANNDPELQGWLKEQGTTLDISYMSFAESANVAKLEGGIDPTKKHGQYNDEEYRNASDVLTRFVFSQRANYGRPRWAFIEATGPAAYIDPRTGELKGPDRGFSTLHQLGELCPEQTRIMVIDRDASLIAKVVDFRRKIEVATPEQLPAIFAEAKMQLARKGEIVDLAVLSRGDLGGIQHEFLESQATAEGVIRSNRETDELKQRMGVEDEETFWIYFLQNLGFNPHHYEIARNIPTNEILTVHQDDLHTYDIVLAHAQWIESLKSSQPRMENLSETIGRNMVRAAIAAGEWFRRDFDRLRIR